MNLTDNDRAMLDGRDGEGCAMAMRIIVRMAELVQADSLLDISAAHIDGCGLLSDSGLLFAETLAGRGAKVRVPTTLSMGPLDLQHWREFDIPVEFAQKAIDQGDAYVRMGCIPAWTCAPYQGYLTPRFGQQIAWGESNAVCYANSVLGARTNRYADYVDICAAITGRVPRVGLHLTENRRGQVVFQLEGFGEDAWQEDVYYAALGHLLGRETHDRVPVIVGLPATADGDQLKALGAAAASSGGVALFHAVGVTPEAPTIEAALLDQPPEEIVRLAPEDVDQAYAELSTAESGEPVHQVVFGCPHFSFDEFRRLSEILRAESERGKAFARGVGVTIISSQTSYDLARRAGLLDELQRWGVRVTLDTCPFHTPLLPPDTEVLVTNSGKCAYYAPGELNVRVAFAKMEDCIHAAIAGRLP